MLLHINRLSTTFRQYTDEPQSDRQRHRQQSADCTGISALHYQPHSLSHTVVPRRPALFVSAAGVSCRCHPWPAGQPLLTDSLTHSLPTSLDHSSHNAAVLTARCSSVVLLPSHVSFRPHLLTYYLPRWKYITAVHLQRCIHLDDQVMLYLLLQCTTLTHINLHRCSQLTDTLFSYLSFAPCARHLQSVVVSGCDGLTSVAVGSIARYCPSLQLLDMDDCDGMNDRALQSASQLPSLRTLRLAGADVRDSGVGQLTSLPHLTHLSLHACQNVTALSAASLAALTQLTWLDLTQLPHITDAMIGVLSSSLPLLSTLLLSRCPLLTSVSLHAISSSLRCLSSLAVSWCALMSDDGLSALSTLSCLSSLCVSRLPRLTDRSLLSLSRCVALSMLDVSGCQSITDVGLGYVGRGCRELRELNVSGCYKITRASLKTLPMECRVKM